MPDVCPELLSLFDLMIDIALKDMAETGALPSTPPSAPGSANEAA